MIFRRRFASPLLVAVGIAPLFLAACGSWPWKSASAESEVGEANAITSAGTGATGDPGKRRTVSDDSSAFGGSIDGDSHQRVAELVTYANSIRSLDPKRLQEEYQQARARFSRTSDPGDRLRLAMLLLEPDTPFRNPEMAQTLLESYLSDSTQHTDGFGDRDFALFLLGNSRSIRRADAAESNSSQRLAAEESRRQKLARRVESLEIELEQLRIERGKLREQVEALKNIEETLRTREQAGDERMKQ